MKYNYNSQQKKQYSGAYILIISTVLFTVFRGIVGNYINPFNYIADVVYIFIAIEIVLIKGNTTKQNKNILGFYFTWIFLCMVILCLQLLFNDNMSLTSSILSFRNNVVYTLPFVLIVTNFTNKLIQKLMKFILKTGSIISLFSIIQFFGSSWLPNKLLSLNVEGTATFYGLDIVRVNGLVGNSIVFGGYTVVLIALAFSKIVVLKEKNFEDWIELFIPIIANALTFNRASNVGTIIVLISVYLLSFPKNKIQVLIKRIIWSAFIGIIFVCVAWNFFSDTVLFQRITGMNQAWVQGTDEEHFSQIDNAISVIEENWLLGYGMGKVGYSASTKNGVIITDGSLWIWILEFGIPMTLFYLLLVIRLLYISFIKRNDTPLNKCISCAFISMSIYLFGFSIVNSAYGARVVFTEWWMVAGMILASNNDHDEIVKIK